MSLSVTKADLREAYGIGEKTFCRWVRLMRKKNPVNKQLFDEWFDRSKYLTPAQVSAFLKHHGEPPQCNEGNPVSQYME